jgi:hypothetical protein
MERKLKKILGRTKEYLDFHSVLNGFRKVGLVGFIEDNDDFNKYAGTNLPPYEEQVGFVKEYLLSKNPQFELIPAWDHLHFVADKDKKDDLESFLKEFPIPIDSKEGQRELGKILSFPGCCVESHYHGKTLAKDKNYQSIPFAPCSDGCAEPWTKEYSKLARKHGIDYKEEFIK